ncbi:MAG: hypothetical protein HYW86_05045 [Candidatus Roizmanbacteria bacterium]|nr:MAG: hypothetical protein HYW86_05045 [Candidatus Roizmanbacteria bacterium]
MEPEPGQTKSISPFSKEIKTFLEKPKSPENNKGLIKFLLGEEEKAESQGRSFCTAIRETKARGKSRKGDADCDLVILNTAIIKKLPLNTEGMYSAARTDTADLKMYLGVSAEHGIIGLAFYPSYDANEYYFRRQLDSLNPVNRPKLPSFDQKEPGDPNALIENWKLNNLNTDYQEVVNEVAHRTAESFFSRSIPCVSFKVGDQKDQTMFFEAVDMSMKHSTDEVDTGESSNPLVRIDGAINDLIGAVGQVYLEDPYRRSECDIIGDRLASKRNTLAYFEEDIRREFQYRNKRRKDGTTDKDIAKEVVDYLFGYDRKYGGHRRYPLSIQTSPGNGDFVMKTLIDKLGVIANVNGEPTDPLILLHQEALKSHHRIGEMTFPTVIPGVTVTFWEVLQGQSVAASSYEMRVNLTPEAIVKINHSQDSLRNRPLQTSGSRYYEMFPPKPKVAVMAIPEVKKLANESLS